MSLSPKPETFRPSSVSEETFSSLFTRALCENDASLERYCTQEICDRFCLLTNEMLRVNAYMNITAITSLHGILVKHYADCALLAPLLPEHASLCDIGCGGGFPSLPIAILRSDITVTAVDSTKKKLDYVAETAHLLGLSNIKVKNARAESLGVQPEYREAFDIVTARAVAAMNILCEWCLPLVRKGGSFLAMKGKNGEEELHAARNAVSVLGGKTQFCRTYLLKDPFSGETAEQEPLPSSENGVHDDAEAMRRCIISVYKQSPTPKQYPRSNARISKKPL
ncbi:MAG: 16S rRNA (guanine(527)-N(7))-methyltransferase RsmG [Eubacteriales bacterium]